MDRLGELVDQMAEAVKSGREVIVVTSGAIGVGMSRLGPTERPKTIPEKAGRGGCRSRVVDGEL